MPPLILISPLITAKPDKYVPHIPQTSRSCGPELNIIYIYLVVKKV